MEVYYPEYYQDFVCIASRCPDSCCKEWSVDIDAESADFYRRLPGALGDRLRQVLQDTEDGTVMAIENGRCPMWRQDGLCQIQAELGHDALCKVCQEFPRLRHDYGTFAELGLELSCPEAARLILSGSGQEMLCQTIPGDETPNYDVEIMDTLRRTRREFLDFLDTTPLPFPRILTILLLYAYEVQEELDGGKAAQLSPESCLAAVPEFAENGDLKSLQEFFLTLEILTPQWKKQLHASATTPLWDCRHKALLRYFICRYWLQAVSDYDIVCRAKFAVTACLLIGFLGGDMIKTAQLFSKEIENDPDNIETILDGVYTVPALTDTHLLALLANATKNDPQQFQKSPLTFRHNVL